MDGDKVKPKGFLGTGTFKETSEALKEIGYHYVKGNGQEKPHWSRQA
jgi:hypothetical protein